MQGMGAVYYKPADVLHWFGEDAKSAKSEAKRKGKDLVKATTEAGIVSGLKQAAATAASFGRGAIGELVQRQAGETGYTLFDAGFEVADMVKTKKVDYSAVRQILSKPNDRFQILYDGGSVTIRPVAHLVAGRLRVPVGWVRNGMEVPYAMLIEEISARSGVEIDPE